MPQLKKKKQEKQKNNNVTQKNGSKCQENQLKELKAPVSVEGDVDGVGRARGLMILQQSCRII